MKSRILERAIEERSKLDTGWINHAMLWNVVLFFAGSIWGFACVLLAGNLLDAPLMLANKDADENPSDKVGIRTPFFTSPVKSEEWAYLGTSTHFALAGTTGVLTVLTFSSVTGPMPRVTWLLFWSLLVMVTATDIHSMRIPNRISMSAAVLFLALSVRVDGKEWLAAVLGALVCSGLLYIIYLFTHGRGMGMGDVKLYISIGALLGPVLGLESLVVASALASAGAGLLMATGRLRRREPFAFVPYIFAGVVLVSYMAPTFNTWYSGLVLG